MVRAGNGTGRFLRQPDGIMRVPAAGGTPELVIASEKGKTLYGHDCCQTGIR